MAKTKAQKAAVVEKLEDALKNAPSAVFVHFSRVSVAEESALRREMRAAGVSYFVAKKTLIRRTLEKQGHKSGDVPLEGEVAIAYGGRDDATAPARLAREAGARFGGKLAILGGIFEGKLAGKAAMEEIAMIPGMQALRAMFAQVVNSPRRRLAIALGAVSQIRAKR